MEVAAHLVEELVDGVYGEDGLGRRPHPLARLEELCHRLRHVARLQILKRQPMLNSEN